MHPNLPFIWTTFGTIGHPPTIRSQQRFFDRTFLTKNLTELAVEHSPAALRHQGRNLGCLQSHHPVRRRQNPRTDAAVSLGEGRPEGVRLERRAEHSRSRWRQVGAERSAVAVFVGTEFDSLTGRGGKDGTPLRKTPWGEIAFQLGGKDAFAVVAKHDQELTAPSSEVIRAFLPKDKPALILMDELLNYMGRNRKSGLTNQLYSFVQNLSEEARAQDRVVLAVSLPSLLDEMTPEDEGDFDRFQKLLDRLGKAMIMSAETETSEIIRRRLFEWGGTSRRGQEDRTGVRRIRSRQPHPIPKLVPGRQRQGSSSPRATRSIRRCFRCSSANGKPCRDSSRLAASCGSWRSGCPMRIRLGSKERTRTR